MTDKIKFVASIEEKEECDCQEDTCSVFNVITLDAYMQSDEWYASYANKDYKNLIDEFQDQEIYQTMENTFELPNGKSAATFLQELSSDSRFKIVETLYK